MKKVTNRFPKKNYVINGAPDFFQRNFTGTVDISIVTPYICPDRWASTFNSAWTVVPTIFRSTAFPAGSVSEQSIGIQGTPTADNSGTRISLEYRIESKDALNFLNNEGFLAFDWLSSANSGAGNTVRVGFLTADVTDDFSAVTEFEFVNFNPVNDGSFAQFKHNVRSIPATVNRGLVIQFLWSNLDAGVNVSANLAQVSFNVGRLYTGFRRAGGGELEAELALCQRYYEKSYDVNTNPQTGGGQPGSSHWRSPSTAGGGAFTIADVYKVTKRATPTVILYSTVGAPATPNTVRDESGGGADIPATASFIGDRSHVPLHAISNNSPYGWHWTADAETL